MVEERKSGFSHHTANDFRVATVNDAVLGDEIPGTAQRLTKDGEVSGEKDRSRDDSRKR